MVKKYKYIDTRQYIRLSSSHLIRYKLLKKEGLGLSTTKNISAGGISFIAKESIPLSSMIELEINLPTASNPIKATAKVLRTEPLKRSGMYKIAAPFFSINEEDRKTIDEYVKQITGDQRKRQWWWRTLK